jgi:hypothetical protein
LLALVSPLSKHSACLCRTCAASPNVTKVLEEAKKQFYLSRPVVQETARIKAFLARNSKAVVLPVVAQSCSLCLRSFSLTRSPASCSVCRATVCDDRCCGGNAVLERTPLKAQFVCRTCAVAEPIVPSGFPFASPGVPLLKRLEPEKNCGLCKAPFSLIKRRKECVRCEKVICGSCSDASFFSPCLDIKDVSTMCRECLEGIKKELQGIIESDPLKKSAAAAELKALMLFLEMPKSAAEVKLQEVMSNPAAFCSICATVYTPATPAGQCVQCDRFCCSGCRKKVIYPALGWIAERDLCIFCQEQPAGQLRDLAVSYSLASLKFPQTLKEMSVTEVNSAAALTLKCNLCNQSFGLKCPPSRCGFCASIVCRTCSFSHVHVSSLLNSRVATSCCRSCWSLSVRASLQALSQTRASSLSNILTGLIRLGDALTGKSVRDPQPVFETLDSRCFVCDDNFSIVRFPMPCSACKRNVCNTPHCSGMFSLPTNKPGQLTS